MASTPQVSNVCIDRNGGAQLVDFGLSIQLPRKHLTDYQAEDRVGVMGYMAPLHPQPTTRGGRTRVG